MMKCRKPAYFDDFQCLAGDCPDSCCQEWDVQVDPDSARRYLDLPGTLGEDLRRYLMPGEDGYYDLQIVNRRCPMWRDDGLCRIQAELGHEGLCQVCQQFPRLTHDYGDFVERGLELSCPEAARLMLTAEPTPFVEEEFSGGVEPEYDTDAMAVLLRTRARALNLLETGSVQEALILLLLYGYRAQQELDGAEEDLFVPQTALSLGAQLGAMVEPTSLTEFYAGLEILTPTWAQRLQNPQPGAWCRELRAMARCGVERYWLQAVSDYDLVSRVKMIVAGCILVRTLGGDVIQTAQQYSKEIDNSAENVDAVLDGTYEAPALTDANLLALLLREGD
jgi:lysine-N-methylase